jgi:hypothetical protein
MDDATQDPQGRGSGSGPDVDVAAAATTAEGSGQDRPAEAGDWSDAADDPGSGVPGGGRHKYASGKTYCGTEN